MEALPANHTYSPTALQFVPNVGSSANYAFAWNDTVTVGSNTYDQVEFEIYSSSGTAVPGSQHQFQIADGNAQSVELDTATIDGTAVIILIYGDDSVPMWSNLMPILALRSIHSSIQQRPYSITLPFLPTAPAPTDASR